LAQFHRLRLSAVLLASVIGASLIGLAAAPRLHAQSAAPADESAFLAENNAAMDKMMADMNVKPTGDVDVDFAAMMIPHHQGAIDMALAQLRYGKNEQLRRIAQEIIVEQQQEIIAMRMALGQPLPASAPAQTQVSPPAPSTTTATAPAHDHSAMSHGAMSSMKK
jgi:uncharacterized protein (DUF305 family)